MKYLHNDRLAQSGRCDCKCHISIDYQCFCASHDILKGPPLPKYRKLRSEKLTSRVVAFATWQPRDKIAVTNNHKVHAEMIR